MATRCTIVPVNFNASAITGGTLPAVAPSAGIDAAGTGGTAFATAWGTYQGIQFINNGLIIMYFWNGTGSVTAYSLIGQKAAGQVPLYSTDSATIGANTCGWLGPWSPQGFTQQDSTVHSGAPCGAVGTGGVGFTCIDFSSITNLSVRLYQLIPAIP